MEPTYRQRADEICSALVLNCPIEGCQAVFLRQKQTQEHLNSHHNAKPFQCIYPSCYYSTGNIRSYKRHLNHVDHGDVPKEPCIYCGHLLQADRYDNRMKHFVKRCPVPNPYNGPQAQAESYFTAVPLEATTTPPVQQSITQVLATQSPQVNSPGPLATPTTMVQSPYESMGGLQLDNTLQSPILPYTTASPSITLYPTSSHQSPQATYNHQIPSPPFGIPHPFPQEQGPKSPTPRFFAIPGMPYDLQPPLVGNPGIPPDTSLGLDTLPAEVLLEGAHEPGTQLNHEEYQPYTTGEGAGEYEDDRFMVDNPYLNFENF